MKIRVSQRNAQRRRSYAFTLVDAIFGMAVAAIMFAALYAGIAFGFNTIKFARENTRATQIMLEHMEILRLYTWDQLNTYGFVPLKFTNSYYSIGGTNSGVMYTGQIQIATANLPVSYSNSLKRITVQLNWSTGKTPRTRSISTYMSKNGMYTYVY